MRFRTQVESRSLLVLILASFFLVNGCQSNQEIKQLQAENAKLKADIEQLKAQQQNSASQVTTSPTPVATESPTPVTTASPAQVAFDDIKGSAAEKEIAQLAQLEVFDTTTGNKFNPSQPITRAEFVRWLVRANNAIWFDQIDKTIRLAEGGEATFADVPPTHPDFRYIQGMANAGIAVGYDEKNFKPDQPLTREQMIAIKIGLDKGGIENAILDPSKAEDSTGEQISANKLAAAVPDWSDRNQISQKFIAAFNSEYYTFWGNNDQWPAKEDKFKNVDRAFGAIKALKPQAPVSHSEAALAISLVGNHTTERDKIDSRTAEQALQLKAKQGTPSPSL
jgi:outer membrane murein-binding lipoprotein Lpp